MNGDQGTQANGRVRYLTLLSFAGVAGVFVFAAPVVDWLCEGSLTTTCQGRGGRVALFTLSRAAVGIPILALCWHSWRAPERAVLPERWVSLSALGLVLWSVACFLTQSTFFDEQKYVVAHLIASTQPWWLFAVAMIAAAPVFEELLFRGFLLYRSLRWSAPVAIAVTASLWTAVHGQYGWPELAGLWSLGVVLACSRLASGRVLTPILLHAVWNAVAIFRGLQP